VDSEYHIKFETESTVSEKIPVASPALQAATTPALPARTRDRHDHVGEQIPQLSP
jgi:hypothetical protein